MALDTSDLHRIAELAKLSISDDEMTVVSNKLNGVLDFITQLNGIDTSNVMPLTSPHETLQPLREDKVTEQDQRERFQAIAPLTKHGLYLVPQVIDSE